MAPASAADQTKPKPSDKPRPAATKMQPMEARTAQAPTFAEAMAARKAAVEQINQAFSAAVKQAQRDYKSERAAAATADAKNRAEANRKASIAAASTARQQALDALGPMPKKP